MLRSIEDVHTIEAITSVRPAWDGAQRHFIILDEVDGLSKDAQKALKGLIEKRESCATFYATTNHLSSLDVGFRQRFQEIPMDQIGVSALMAHANDVLKSEGFKVRKPQLQAVCQHADGSLRLLNRLLEQLLFNAKSPVRQTSSSMPKPKKSA